MGVTIHYRGKLKSPKMIHRIYYELKEIADMMGWESTLFDEDLSATNTAHIEYRDGFPEIIGHLPLKGVYLNIHKDCEGISFLFDAKGVLWDPVEMAEAGENPVKAEDDTSFVSVKTQFAPASVHITFVRLLRYVEKKFFQTLEVKDEAHYWESDDESRLQRKLTLLGDNGDPFDPAAQSGPSLKELRAEADRLDCLIAEKFPDQ